MQDFFALSTCMHGVIFDVRWCLVHVVGRSELHYVADNQQTDGPIPAAEIKELFQLLVRHGSDINQKSASEPVLLTGASYDDIDVLLQLTYFCIQRVTLCAKQCRPIGWRTMMHIKSYDNAELLGRS